MSGMAYKQRGLTVSKLLLICVVVGAVALIVIKLLPEYVEFWKIRSDVVAIGTEVNANPDATVADVRHAFDRRAEIDEIRDFRSTDLDVTKDGGQIVVAFSYERKIHMFSNISVVIDFEGSSEK